MKRRQRGPQAGLLSVDRAAFFIVCGLCIGCGGSPEQQQAEPPIPTAPPQSRTEDSSSVTDSRADGDTAGTVTKRYDGITYEVPRAWRELPRSAVVDSKFEIDTPHGTLELTLTTMGGGIEANLERWVGQVHNETGAGPRRSTIEIDGRAAERIDIRGTYRSGFGPAGSEKPNYRLIGIGLLLEPRPFFIKLVGPRQAVAEFLPEFDKFVASGKIER